MTGVPSHRTEEGVWVLSRLGTRATALSSGCGLGAVDDPDAVYRRDVICTVEYGEVLLLSADETRILRAHPLPGLPPQWLLATDDAVLCGRQGDGGLRDSMLCRIDRRTGGWTVRVLPSIADSTFVGPEAAWVPDHWSVAEATEFTGFHDPALVDGALTFDDGRLRFDPTTLERLP